MWVTRALGMAREEGAQQLAEERRQLADDLEEARVKVEQQLAQGQGDEAAGRGAAKIKNTSDVFEHTLEEKKAKAAEDEVCSFTQVLSSAGVS